jgi:hypothetical protein
VPLSTESFVFALVVSTAMALLVFGHADRHGNRHATAWGIAAFFFGVLGAAVYFARYYLRRR